MNSLTDLNNYCATFELSYLDQRNASVIFDSTAASNQIIVVNEHNNHVIPLGIDINNIIQGETMNVEFKINLTGLSSATVNWGILPSGVSLTTSGNIYTLSGITTKEIWDQIKHPIITSSTSGFGDYVYQAEIDYYPSKSKGWTINLTLQQGIFLDSNFVIFADPTKHVGSGALDLGGHFSLNVLQSRITNTSSHLYTNATLRADGRPAQRGNSHLYTTATLTIEGKNVQVGGSHLYDTAILSATGQAKRAGRSHLYTNTTLRNVPAATYSTSAHFNSSVILTTTANPLYILNTVASETSAYSTYLYSTTVTKVASDFPSELLTFTLTPDELIKPYITGYTPGNGAVSYDNTSKVITITGTFTSVETILDTIAYTFSTTGSQMGYRYDINAVASPTNFPTRSLSGVITKYNSSSTIMSNPTTTSINANGNSTVSITGAPVLNNISNQNVMKIYSNTTNAISYISCSPALLEKFYEPTTVSSFIENYYYTMSESGLYMAVINSNTIRLLQKVNGIWTFLAGNISYTGGCDLMHVREIGSPISITILDYNTKYTYIYDGSFTLTNTVSISPVISGTVSGAICSNTYMILKTSTKWYKFTWNAGLSRYDYTSNGTLSNKSDIAFNGGIVTISSTQLTFPDLSAIAVTGGGYCAISPDSSYIAASTSNYLYIYYKSGSTYTLIQTLSGLPYAGMSSIKFSYDNSKIYGYTGATTKYIVLHGIGSGASRVYSSFVTGLDINKMIIDTTNGDFLNSDTSQNLTSYKYYNGTIQSTPFTVDGVSKNGMKVTSDTKDYINKALSQALIHVNTSFNTDDWLIYRYEDNYTGTLSQLRSQKLTGL